MNFCLTWLAWPMKNFLNCQKLYYNSSNLNIECYNKTKFEKQQKYKSHYLTSIFFLILSILWFIFANLSFVCKS